MSNYDPNAYGQYGAGVARVDQAAIDQGLRSYMLGIYNHMVIGLAITALVAIGVSMMAITGNPAGAAKNAAGAAITLGGGRFLTQFGYMLFATPLKWVVMLAPLAFILVLSWRFDRMSVPALMGTFWAFAAVMGISMGSIFLIYKLGSIAQVFFITAASFAGLSLIGYTTKKDLSGMGKFLMMGLIGLMIASIVNIFMQASALQFAINVIGVLVFAGLTAYDTQRLKNDYYEIAGDATMIARASIAGALSLYLNFINMFQMLLSLFGNRE
ncbi:MAG: Bax inhibitor-1/YccA family protein [Beijerinckiaceae bacterium]